LDPVAANIDRVCSPSGAGEGNDTLLWQSFVRDDAKTDLLEGAEVNAEKEDSGSQTVD
jgi:hypothetical protein